MLNGISAVTTGQFHIDNNSECQDYAELDLDRKDYVMAAVADGYSSKKYFRSARGSQFAAESAKDSIYEYMNDYNRFIEAYEADRQYLINRIIKMTITKWHLKIKDDLEKNPITQEEIDKYLDGDFNKEEIYDIYGTTLLAGVMSKMCNFGFLIGDGSFVVIDKHGKVETPILERNNIENEKTLLSNPNSFNKFSTCFLDEMPFAIMISTEGLAKSFSNDEDFLNYNNAIAKELGNLNTIDDKIEMEEKLGKLFEQRSRESNQDDISISIIFNKDSYEEVARELENKAKIQQIDEEINNSKQKIEDLEFKGQQIINERNANRENIDKVNQEKKDLEEYNVNLDERKQKLEEQLKQLQEQLDQLCQEEENINNRKIELDSLLMKYEIIEQEKEDEQNKNLEDKKLEEENIRIKEEEKRQLQSNLNN